MSDACILCDANVPLSLPHFVVDRVTSQGLNRISEFVRCNQEMAGVLCGDTQACLQRAVIRSLRHETFHSEHQLALKDAVQRFVSFGEMIPG